MGLTAFDPESSSSGTSERGMALQRIHANTAGDRSQAIADLTQQKRLSHHYGVQGEWEVRTTLEANRQAWRYRSSVLAHGEEVGEFFAAIEVNRTRQMRQVEAVTEDMLASFVREAVEVHFSRCASVEEYSLLASIYSQPLPRRHRLRNVVLSLLCLGGLSLVSWLWLGSDRLGLDHLYGYLRLSGYAGTAGMQWQSPREAYQASVGEAFHFPLPALKHLPGGASVAPTLEVSGEAPTWVELDRQRLNIHGTAPLTSEGQTYRFVVRARTPQGSESRLPVLLTVVAPAEPMPTAPQLRGHWAW
jgi:hypothetical protein